MSGPAVKGWCPGALSPMRTGDGLLVRVRITGGVLTPALAASLAGMSRRFGNGLVDITSRANLQLRGVGEASLVALQAELDAAGLLDRDAASERVRNVLASPLAGLDPACHPAIPRLARALEDALVAAADLHPLPAKFGFLLDGGGSLPLDGVEADARFVAGPDGRFEVEAGGRALGSVREDEVVATALRLARAFLNLREGDERRMREVAHRLAGPEVPPFGRLAPLSSPASEAREGDPEAEFATPGSPSLGPAVLAGDDSMARPSAFAGDDSMARPSAFAGDDRWARPPAFGGDDKDAPNQCPRFLPAFAPFGRLTADQLHGLARLAEADGAELRLTPWRALLLAPCRATLPADIARLGLLVDAADPRLAFAACPGSAGCQSGEADVQHDALAFAQALAPLLDQTVSVHVSGCAKGCACRRPATLTLVAEAGRYGLAFGADARAPSQTPLMTAAETATYLKGLDKGRLHAASFENA
jgi:precorrin-3B synthase